MSKVRVYPYKQGSASAKALAEAMDGKVLKLQGSKYRPRAGDLVINWGSSNVPDFGAATVLNKNVSVAQNKREAFIAMDQEGVSVPDFWTSRETLMSAGAALQFPVVCRTVLNGHSGAGIVVANTVDELVDAPLYTRYVKKKDEYRVHLVMDDEGNQFTFVQRKARKLDHENPNWMIRNLAGGFAFVEAQLDEVPHSVLEQAANAIEALGLDFGGVDVIWNEREQKAYVLECNTACGLEERTAQWYAAAFPDAYGG